MPRREHDDDGWALTIEGLTEVRNWIEGKGVDVGCGSAPVNPRVALPIDRNGPPESCAELAADCSTLDFLEPDSLDFIFSSHVLEDFENIPEVFRAWLTRLKVGGVMILLLPDMERGRYPRVGDANGNPSHLTDVGPEYMTRLAGEHPVTILQIDTVPQHCSTFDIVLRRDA